MLWACIVLPQLAMDAVLRQLPDPEPPLALVTGPAQLRSLHAVNAAAAAAGLRPGMRLAAAQALLAQVRTFDHDPAAEQASQALLAAWAYRHSSLVSAQWPGAIVLEVQASFRLFGPWPQLQQRLREELTALGFQHRIALAPTARAAWVLAGLGDGLDVHEPAALAACLDRVPVAAAALPDASGERLRKMGVTTLKALRALPGDGLRRRFGAALLEHLQRLYGEADEHLAYYLPPDRFDARIELGYEVESHTALLFPLRRLLGDLGAFLSIRDGGVQHFVLRLEHERGHTDLEVGLLAAERSPVLLFELTRNRLEHLQLQQPVLALRLLAEEVPAFVPVARDLFDLRPQQAQEWPQLRERLRARLGDAAVYRLALAADPRPERSWSRWQGDAVPAAVPVTPALPPRPTWLLSQPQPLNDPRLRVVSGPERLESGWWDGGDARRDYYVVETRGRRGWAFVAVGSQQGWMLQGWFA